MTGLATTGPFEGSDMKTNIRIACTAKTASGRTAIGYVGTVHFIYVLALHLAERE